MAKKKRKTKKSIKFSTRVVVFCIAFMAVYTAVQTTLSYKVGIELSPTLTQCVYTFFGTELALSAVIKIFEDLTGKKTKKKTTHTEEYIPEEF